MEAKYLIEILSKHPESEVEVDGIRFSKRCHGDYESSYLDVEIEYKEEYDTFYIRGYEN